jgi:small GTP-binding protein
MTYGFKLLLLGDGGVGKTALAERYATGSFCPGTKMTLGAAFHSVHRTISGEDIALQVWDLGGEKRFRFFLPSFCIGAGGAILAFDLTRYETLVHVPEWVAMLREQATGIPVIIVCTKADLADQRTVNLADAETVAQNLGISCVIETSSVAGQNVEAAFTTVTRLMLDSPSSPRFQVNFAKAPTC